MTRIEVHKKGPSVRLTVREHATGSRDVCTGISVLCCTLVNYLASRGLETKALTVSSGFVNIEFSADKAAEEVFDAIALGLNAIAKKSPNFAEYASYSEP
jgi:uncharacterized protein YsxB (DUF464 family)